MLMVCVIVDSKLYLYRDSIFLQSRDKSREEKEKNKKVRSIGELISKAISSLVRLVQ